jgi:hypothetical protein
MYPNVLNGFSSPAPCLFDLAIIQDGSNSIFLPILTIV